METIVAITPWHTIDPQIAIAASKAGELGILDLGLQDDAAAITAALHQLRSMTGAVGRWGVRWDTFGADSRGLDQLANNLQGEIPVLVLAGLKTHEVLKQLKAAERLAQQVFLEVHDQDTALAAQAAGYAGLIVKGHEAGGQVGKSSSFILLQELRGPIKIPYWIQGGISMHSAAAAVLAGATGVVLAEQLWLTQEGPCFSPGQRELWSRLDGSETLTIGRDADLFRLSNRHGRGKLRELELAVAKGAGWQELLQRQLSDHIDPLMPVGQDIAFAGAFGQRYVTVGSVIMAMRNAIDASLSQAGSNNHLAPDSPLAKLHGTRYPIVQGPMTRVSDVAPFAKAVAEAGGLPFLALAVMRGPQARALLVKAKELMGQRSWGVGILGFMPLDLRQEQMEAVREVKPPFAIIAGGRPSQARELEDLNISTYLHVPSPGLLKEFLKEGARKFIFEGSECGGHTGPRTSFTLWGSAIDTLLNAEIKDPESVQVLFAGGIHNAMSAAMVSVMAAPLSERRMKIGVLMGTAYLFTQEAVHAGAIVQEFQEQAIACEETAVLQSGVGIYTRCAKTNFCNEFDDKRNELLLDTKSDDQILMELELLNIGRLRIASKGVSRNANSTASDGTDRYTGLDVETQRREGLYMMGEVARLRKARVSMAELHNDVSAEATAVLAQAALRQAEHKHPAMPKPHEDIAIVGMASLLPGASDLPSYWQNIMLAVNAIREVPESRWRADDFFDPKRGIKDKVYSRWGGFLDDVAFDPTHYGIPPASLRSIEPIQLLALHIASKALEDAGFDRRPFPRERTATIFAASGMNDLGMDYIFRTLLTHYLPKVEGVSEDNRKRILDSLCEHDLPKWTEDSFPGMLANVVSGRVANRLDLRGTNFTVDAACAASLAALDTGIRQLRSGDADVALVGSVDGANNVLGFMTFAQTHALSPRGRCRPFDDSADGIALGEGVAAVVLKRLTDAERDGDKIYAVIKGIGSSSDGHNRSLTAPHPQGQVRAIERAYADAGVDPASVTLIEAHGTGTALGDRSEIESLNLAFGTASTQHQYCAVGSVKSMIGHTKVTAGLAALIKASLALKHRVLPPTLGVERPSSRVDFPNTPFYINTEARPWLGMPEGQPRRCGVSAFGFGGTNFHTVLEEYRGEYRPSDSQDLNPRAAEIFAFGRAKRPEVEQAVRTLLQGLAQPEHLNLAQLAYAVHLDEARVRPKNGALTCQLAIVASSVADLKTKLEFFLRESKDKTSIKAPQGIYYREQEHREDSGAVCMLFSGQGSQRINMLRDLVLTRPASYALFERADALLKEALPQPLSRYIYPLPSFTKEEQEQQQKALNDTHVAQPALGVIDLTALDFLTSFGLRPNFVAGHSYGEYVALCAAGVISRDDLIRLSEVRGRIAAQTSKAESGTMAAVNADEARVVEAINRLGLAVSVANLNAPDQTIIAGSAEAIDAAVKALIQESLRIKPIAVTAAFHCAAMAEAQEALAAELAKITFQRPQISLFSNTTGNRYPDDPGEIQALLARHIAEPLRFVDEIQHLYEAGARVFIEAGPGLVLSGLVDRILGDRPHVSLGIDVPDRPGWLQFAHLLAQVFSLGLPINLEPWFQRRGLADTNLEQTLAQARAKAQPGPMVWRVNGGKAVPWYTPIQAPSQASTKIPTPPKTPSLSAPSIHKPINTQAAQDGALPNGLARPAINPAAAERASGSTAAPASQNSFVEREGRPVVSNYDPSSRIAASPPAAYALGSESRFTEVQGSLAQLIDLQRTQQETLRRFFEFQEHWLTGQRPEMTAPSNSVLALANVQPLPAQLPPVPARAPAATIVPPAPVLPKFAVAPSPHGAKPTQPAPAAFASPTLNAVPARAPAMSGNGSAKAKNTTDAKAFAPTEQFKADLLRAASERTGYSEDMLDLDAHMEADLGIDSIKRIEIFSKLKDQYPFMEGRAEETVFEELSSLKTLNAVINWYDGLRQTLAKPGGGADPIKIPPLAASVSLLETAAPQNSGVGTNGSAADHVILKAKSTTDAHATGEKAFAPTEQFKADLLHAAAERTGYSEDMLDLDAHMEADLGIDSIKRIEIFSKLKDQYPFMEGRAEETVFEELSSLKTLNAVIDWYDGLHQSMAMPEGADSVKKSQTPSSVSLPEAAESIEIMASADEVQRYTVTPVAAPRDGMAEMNGFPADRLILLVGDVPILGTAFRDRLTAKHYHVRQIVSGTDTHVLDEDRIEVDFSSLDGVSKLRALIAEKGQKVGALFNLAGLGTIADAANDQHLEYARRLFLLLKVLETDLKESAPIGGGWLINLTAFDGQFGLRQTRAFPALHAGTLGVAKSVAREWPGIRVKCIDVDPDIDLHHLVTEVLREVGNDDQTVEVGFTPKERWKLDLGKGSATAADLSTLDLDSNSVLLVTGGAYGITADVTQALAEKFHPRLVLVGRSPMPEEEAKATRDLVEPQQLQQYLIHELRAQNPKTTPAEVNRALKRMLRDRQIRANLAAMRAAGAEVDYHTLDIRDGEAFGRLIDDVYARWGRIDGVLHGAGVIDDKSIRDKSPESFDIVFTTKVVPATVLANKLRPEGLKFLMFFSSIAGRFGNAGQSDYSAANEVVNKLADRLSHDWPHVHTIAINWGPWDGGMVSDELRRLYATKNIHPIPVAEGRQRCLEELGRSNSGKPEIVVAASLQQIAQLALRQ
ncbi:type I polyketide synthase [Beijerinckia indica]|uniref:Erythronolide synthase n=1 Tax=Beijerinckia indica subsp. indica (strain ATCC 9039 / DSM 1715 / NCIMB 8712) TaxID=395963 RepID=B2ILM7_BEII9|nr:type I polyketide synthase [Beijerinckia indica]ACB97427.1 Erythronolide synthase [Beijerinckia indica subsp. indica ATCC 9039]